MSVESIVQATYQNADRKKINKLPWFWTATVYQQDDTAQFILGKIRSQLQSAELKFNKAAIMSHDVSRLTSAVDKNKWLSELKNSKWAGPFKWEKGEHYYF